MIIFDHRRKCAGTYIRFLFKRQFNFIRLPGSTHYKTVNFENHPGRGIQFICGTDFFTSLHRGPYDFYFTVLRNPVDVLYSSANMAHKENVVRELGYKGTQKEYVAEFIDRYLNDPNSVGWVHQVKTHWSSIQLDLYDFVGIQENMPETIRQLNAILGISLGDAPRKNASPGPHKHRRKELEQHFFEEIWMWRTAKDRIVNGFYLEKRYDPFKQEWVKP